MAADNEGRCCDAVLRILEAEHGAPRQDFRRDTDPDSGVEVTCTIGGQRYALEHTLIELYEGNTGDDLRLASVFSADFEAGLADVMKPHLAYEIVVNAYAFDDYKGKQLATVRTQLLAWARAAAPLLPEPEVGTPRCTSTRADWPNAPLAVTLKCWHSSANASTLRLGSIMPEHHEDRRRARLLRALEAKGPKLHATSGGKARTVLVAENRDNQQTNEVILRDTFNALCTDFRYPPQEIYVVDTRPSGDFFVSQVRRRGAACLFLGTPARDWHFRAADLTDI